MPVGSVRVFLILEIFGDMWGRRLFFVNLYTVCMMKRIVVGVDEVGRGPLAGPVCVCALAILTPLPHSLRGPIRDSKQLSRVAREELYRTLTAAAKKGLVRFSVSMTGVSLIDKKGIVYAIQSALNRALKKLSLSPDQVDIKLDGSLHAPRIYQHQETIIRGDASVRAIALASIVAKVVRDRRMCQYAKKYPAYGFEAHKGYGTKAHRAAIVKKGILPIHRVTFLKYITK